MINGRWKKLHSEVTKYNAEIPTGLDANLRQLPANDIRVNDIDNDHICNITRSTADSECVVYKYGRDGIRLYFIQQQVVEERNLLQLHA